MTIMSDLNVTGVTNLGLPKGHLRGKSSKYSGLGGVDTAAAGHVRQDTQDDNEFETFDLALQGMVS